jgi:NitT/TauT family transport system substrate-binding protein
MTDARQKEFYDKMVALKLVDGNIDIKKGYSLDFVCKGVGMDLVK